MEQMEHILNMERMNREQRSQYHLPDTVFIARTFFISICNIKVFIATTMMMLFASLDYSYTLLK